MLRCVSVVCVSGCLGLALAAGTVLVTEPVDLASPAPSSAPAPQATEAAVTAPAVPEIVQTRIEQALFARLSPEHQRMILNTPQRPLMMPAELLACFAPDTPDEVMRAFNHGRPGAFGGRHNAVVRWGQTASQPAGTGDVGNPIVLTWSFVPDGTILPNAVGEGDLPSELFAWLNTLYGSQANWLPVFQAIFDRWEALSGLDFVYEPNDDGAEFPSSQGVLGVRGDIRISAKNIDGNSGILAYNYYPNTGDMVINSFDSFYNNLGGDSLRMRNVLAHEVGHGLGFAHVCPVQRNKLMEPFVATGYDGPRHDDIRAAHFNYGDVFENNDTIAEATLLGPLSIGAPVAIGDVPGAAVANGSLLSLDSNEDVDWYSISVAQRSVLTVTITPRGFLYDDATQSCNGLSGSCCYNQFDDSASTSGYTIEVRTPGGALVATRSVVGAGPHTLPALLSGPGEYVVGISAAGITNPPVLYALSLGASLAPVIVEYADPGLVWIQPGTPTPIVARASAGTQSLGAVSLRYSVNGAPMTSVVMGPGSQAGEWIASLPPVACGSTIVYSVRAEGSSGGSVELSSITARTGIAQVAFGDDFETDRGWTTENNAVTGAWERVDPIGTIAQPEDDTTPNGVTAWITQQSTNAGEASGTNDVDSGAVTLISPAIDVAALSNVRVSYQRWYSNTTSGAAGGQSGSDAFRIEVSSNNGATWVPAETVGPGLFDDINNQSGWRRGTFTLAGAGVQPTAQMRVRFIAEDLGAGTSVEAAIDDFEVTGLACAPGNACDYDYNQDENVDLTDAQQMAQVFVGLLTPESNWLDGDLNGDENADLTDAQILAAYVVTGNCGV
jgi:hypothetical protein